MITAAVAPVRDDLSWVQFSEDEADACWLCDNEAVVRAILDRGCPHAPNPVLMCLPHYEMLREQYGMPPLQIQDTYCPRVITVLRVEPVRR